MSRGCRGQILPPTSERQPRVAAKYGVSEVVTILPTRCVSNQPPHRRQCAQQQRPCPETIPRNIPRITFLCTRPLHNLYGRVATGTAYLTRVPVQSCNACTGGFVTSLPINGPAQSGSSDWPRHALHPAASSSAAHAHEPSAWSQCSREGDRKGSRRQWCLQPMQAVVGECSL